MQITGAPFPRNVAMPHIAARGSGLLHFSYLCRREILASPPPPPPGTPPTPATKLLVTPLAKCSRLAALDVRSVLPLPTLPSSIRLGYTKLPSSTLSLTSSRTTDRAVAVWTNAAIGGGSRYGSSFAVALGVTPASDPPVPCGLKVS